MTQAQTTKISKPCYIAIFGGSGDLAKRKLIPALYNLYLDGWLPEHYVIYCLGRKPVDNNDFLAGMKEDVSTFSRRGKVEDASWDAFSKHLYYYEADFTQQECYTGLTERVNNFITEAGTSDIIRLFYLAVAPQFFAQIGVDVSTNGLASDEDNDRLVIEKPFGSDRKSAHELNQTLLEHYKEKQLYRIDHYLGKETVQNILIFRFANAIFEPLWNEKYIDHVQITVAEQIGVEGRGAYYDSSGALRDMIQNHVLQLLCFVAMEAPNRFTADELRNSSVNVLRNIDPIPEADVPDVAVRGQYDKGWIKGTEVIGYREEQNVSPTSNTETFAAVKFKINNWRWSRVPFYVRSGKRMHKTVSQIMIQFKDVPHMSFPPSVAEEWEPNRIVINIQPEMTINIYFQAKVPGLNLELKTERMNFSYKEAYPSGTPEAYETLLLDALEGDATLFMREDQVDAAWAVVMPILNNWQKNISTSFPNYEAGTNGPAAADTLLAKDGRSWFKAV